MRRALALPVSLACCLSALTVRADDAPEQAAPTPHPSEPTPPSAPAPANVDSAFSILVELGDKARQRGNINDAANAYYAALKLKNDATIRGRLGVIAAQINEPVAAAADLLEAIERGGGSTAKESDEFHRAFKSVRPLVCNLHITGNVFDAEVAIDDGKARREIGPTFKLFVTPGPHLVHGRSETRGDARAQVDCPKGGEGFAVLEWRASNAVPPPPPPAPPAPTDKSAKTIVIRESTPPAPPKSAPVAPEPPKPRGRFAIGGGPTMVLGAAPSPSLGASIVGQYRQNEYSAIAIARGAWSLGSVESRPIDIFSASAFAGPCVQWRWFDGCALAGATFFARRVDPNPLYRADTVDQVIPALGLGVGATYAINSSLSARIFADVTALTRDMVIDVAADSGAIVPVWQTQRFIFSLSASLVFGR